VIAHQRSRCLVILPCSTPRSLRGGEPIDGLSILFEVFFRVDQICLTLLKEGLKLTKGEPQKSRDLIAHEDFGSIALQQSPPVRRAQRPAMTLAGAARYLPED